MQTYGEDSYEAVKEKKKIRHFGTLPTWACWTLFLVGWLGFEFVALLVQMILGSTSLAITQADVDNCTTAYITYATWANFITYLIMFILMVTLFYLFDPAGFKNKMKAFVNGRTYIGVIIFFFAMSFCANLYGLMENLMEKSLGLTGTNSNQSIIIKMVTAQPLALFFELVIFAPVSEELAYRQGLFEAVSRKSRVWAYIAVIMVFGLIHVASGVVEDLTAMSQAVNGSEDYIAARQALQIELLALPSYMIAGGFLSWCYDRNGKSVVSSFLAHMLNNLISFIEILVVANSSEQTAAIMFRQLFLHL